MRFQSGYLYHYAFVMLIGVAGPRHLLHAVGEVRPMASWPILSLVTFLPLVGALFCLVVNGPKEAVDRNCTQRRAASPRWSPS